MANFSRPTLLFTCGREPGYTRNAALQNALARHFELVRITSASRSLAVRTLRVGWGLLTRRSPVQAAVVGFYGQPLMFPARLFVRQPILFDAFLSTYETLTVERRRFAPGSPLARLARWLDRTACALAERVLLDTQADVDYFAGTLGVPRRKLRRLFVGCNEQLYYPRPEIQPVAGRVLFWGSFLPLQGVDVILRAAGLLKAEAGISFRFIGEGPHYPLAQRMAAEQGLERVEFLPYLPQPQMPGEVARAAVCLTGEFGDFEKSRRVIAGKTFQVMAMARVPVVGDCPGNRELLTPGLDACFVPMNDPAALAQAIRSLVANPPLAAGLGAAAAQTFAARASTAVQAEELRQIITEILSE